MIVVRWVATVVCLLICVVLFFAPSIGAASLFLACFVVLCWSFGAFERDFWIEDEKKGMKR
ncbi:hypothetical protein [Microbacterium sp. KR10-403]|uniref:hypothetical protein n=1 Tax=Microbacterium sp. KR10-403 TaxID=3158581 RepID=UPI0032E45733